MFDMLLESGRRSSLLPGWGKGVALTLHVTVLGILWRAPAHPAPVPPPVVIESIAFEPARPHLDRSWQIPGTGIDEWTIHLPPPNIPTIPGGSLDMRIGDSSVATPRDPGPLLDTGGGVYDGRLLQEAPELLTAPVPAYPPLLRSAGVQGRVIVAAVVDTLGLAESGSVRIVLSDNPGFDASALATVRGARFRPGRVYGRAVRVLVQVPVVFRLN